MYDWNLGSSGLNTWLLLMQARDTMDREMRVALSRQSVTAEQLSVLFFLSHYPEGANVDEISTWCFREKASTIQQLTRMEKIGLVSRTKKDRQRHVFFSLTSEGKQLLKMSAKTSTAMIKHIEQQFSEKDVQRLNEDLKRIRDSSLARLGLQAIQPRKANT
jgi:DNA-binding MarR family transcriptional regulator